MFRSCRGTEREISEHKQAEALLLGQMQMLEMIPISASLQDVLTSLVRVIESHSHDAAITNAIIAMAHSLNLRVIAEGVEMIEQATFQRACQCVFAQDCYYSKPVTPAAFVELLRRQPLLSTA